MNLSATSPQPGEGSRGMAWIIFALAIIAFIPSLANDFTGWDDTAYIIDNPLMQSLDGLRQIWFSTENEQYYPVTFTAFWLEYRMFGENPLGYHIVNVLLHAINSVLVFVFLRKVFGNAHLIAIAAMLFAIHPVQAMTVAWVAQQKNLFACLFAILTFMTWLKAPSARGLLIASACYALTLLSKSAMIGLPLSLLAMDVLFRNRTVGSSLLRVLPLVVMAIGSAVLTVMFEQKFVDAADPQSIPPAFERMLLAMATPWWYVKQLLWPVNLSPLYPIWEISVRDWRWWIAPIANVAAFAGLLLWWRRSRSFASALTLWAGIHLLGLLGPVLGFIPYGNMHATPVSDHFLYVACIGPFALISVAAAHVACRFAKPVSMMLGIVAALLLLWLTIENVRVYRDDHSLWQRSLERAPESFVAHLAMGTVWKNRGHDTGDAQQFQRALQSFAAAANIRPNMADAHWYAGETLYELGDLAAAETALRNALDRNPNLPKAVLRLAAILEQTGRPNDALAMFERAVALDPNDATARLRLGGIYIGFARYEDAQPQFQAAISLEPKLPMAYVGLATCERARGNWPAVIDTLEKGVARAGDDVAVLNMLAMAYATSPDDSVRDGERAVKIMEEVVHARRVVDVELLNTLAAAYAEAGWFDEAVQVSQQAIELAERQNAMQLSAEIKRRMALYQSGKPLRWAVNASTD